ncbi:MAG: hypothetical protein RQ754_04280 [Desulfuromonadales bacterium]|jgi:hypothetical protein|nr:hypothetical protein [Desulfuromonadales bacterium]
MQSIKSGCLPTGTRFCNNGPAMGFCLSSPQPVQAARICIARYMAGASPAGGTLNAEIELIQGFENQPRQLVPVNTLIEYPAATILITDRDNLNLGQFAKFHADKGFITAISNHPIDAIAGTWLLSPELNTTDFKVKAAAGT